LNNYYSKTIGAAERRHRRLYLAAAAADLFRSVRRLDKRLGTPPLSKRYRRRALAHRRRPNVIGAGL